MHSTRSLGGDLPRHASGTRNPTRATVPARTSMSPAAHANAEPGSLSRNTTSRPRSASSDRSHHNPCGCRKIPSIPQVRSVSASSSARVTNTTSPGRPRILSANRAPSGTPIHFGGCSSSMSPAATAPRTRPFARLGRLMDVAPDRRAEPRPLRARYRTEVSVRWYTVRVKRDSWFFRAGSGVATVHTSMPSPDRSFGHVH